MQAARNHQMDYEPEIAVDTDRDSFADATQFPNRPAFRVGNGRLDGSEQKRRQDADAFKRLTDNSRLKRRYVRRDIGQFRHYRDA